MSDAIRDRLYDWPEIDGKDHIGLRDFADYLQQCNMAMEHLEGLNILNDCRENTKLLRKLPEYLQSRWARRGYPSFSQFAFLVTNEADIVCNHVLCKLRPDNSEGKKRYKTEEHNKGKHFQHRGFASQTVAPKVELLCKCCNRPNHTLERCWSFNSKSSDEKRELILLKKEYVSLA